MYKNTLRRFATGLKYTDPTNPKVFMTVSKDGKPLGKMIFELYKNHNPKTVDNFLSLCKGDRNLTYKGSPFHRIIPQFMAQGGDITNGNGTGGLSIYGRTFPDENMSIKHIKRGQLSMANSGKNTNGSQFFITFIPAKWLDEKHTVFGEMVEGEEILKKLETLGSQNGKTTGLIKIDDCGEVEEIKKV